MKELRVLISAGGTGGHIYPALSIINKIKDENPHAKFLYIGTTDRMEASIIPNLNIPYIGIEMKGLKKNIKYNIKSLSLFFKALKRCKMEIKRFDPSIVIGVGGYITAPVIYSAKKLGYKVIIHEQNSIPGKTNRYLAKYADCVMISLPKSKEFFKHKNIVLTGNPRSEEALNAQKINIRELGFDPKKKLVMIVMGSLGSFTINQELMKIIPKFKNKDYQVLVITGDKYYDSFKNLDIPKNVVIKPFLNNMLNVLGNVSLIITRAGASTIAEILALKVPSIFVPSPYVANNHQYYNANELVLNKASLLLEEKDFKEDILLNKIDMVLNNPKLLQEMKDNMQKMRITDSSDRIYQVIESLIK